MGDGEFQGLSGAVAKWETVSSCSWPRGELLLRRPLLVSVGLDFTFSGFFGFSGFVGLRGFECGSDELRRGGGFGFGFWVLEIGCGSLWRIVVGFRRTGS